jgi:6-phosphogluconolactonase (cycloisomerase 2 family)
MVRIPNDKEARMKAFISIATLFLTLLLSGCLGSSSSSTAPTLAFAYIVGAGDNSIHALVQKSTGELTSSTLPFFSTNPNPVAMALHPSKNFIYVANEAASTVSGFALDHTTGILTPVGTAVAPSPTCPTSPCNPVSLGINSAGTFLFVLNQGSSTTSASIAVFSIDGARGLLTPIAGSPFTFASLAAPNPQFLAVAPNASVLYVSNGSSGTISAFSVGGSGAPTEIAGSPFTGGAFMAGLVIDPKGQFLYAADTISSKIAGFSVQSGGALTPVAGSPFTTDLGPVALALDSTGATLFSANQGGATVSSFKTASGALTQVAGSPFSLVPSGNPQPAFLTVDPTNTFLYVGNVGTRSITGFTIHSDGTLQLLPTSPFQQTIGPRWILMTN